MELPGELFDARTCLHFIGALPQNCSETFGGIGLSAVPRSNISHPEKEQLVATPVVRLSGRAQGISITHEDGFAGIWHDGMRDPVTPRSRSRQSRVLDRATANTSLHAWFKD